MKRVIFLLVLVLAFVGAVGKDLAAQAMYSLPNDDANCPANCRAIPWLTGSDIWNGGTLPVYPVGTNCTGLTEGRQTTTDNATAIQKCVNNTTSGHAALIPAGIYYVNGQITLKDGVVLRGAGGGPGSQGRWLNGINSSDTWDNSAPNYWGDTLSASPTATTTTLYLGASGSLFSGYGGDIGTLVALTGGYTKGSTAVTTTTNPTQIIANSAVFIAEQPDTSIPVTDLVSGTHTCTYCGLPSPYQGTYLMSQVIQVTSVQANTPTSGMWTINLKRPLYYTFKSDYNPIIAAMTSFHSHQAVEDLVVAGVPGSNASRSASFIDLQGEIEGWVARVQGYNGPQVNALAMYRCEFCYGNEVRDSYFHAGDGAGGQNYCIFFFLANSDNKIENNICREMRHGLILEGGGSGNAYLYNYVDDMVSDDQSYVNNLRANHGAHPYMMLYEGNVASTFASDFIHGSSSHFVLFRNWFRGDNTGNRDGWNTVGASGLLWNYTAFEVDGGNRYYSAVGNVLGGATLTGNYHAQWATGHTWNNGACPGASGNGRDNPYGAILGCDNNHSGTYDSTIRSTTILHGNWDQMINGVLFWDGGSNHTLPNSMYPPYSTKPAFFASCAWPPFGPNLNPVTNTLPAVARYQASSPCGSGGGGKSGTSPASSGTPLPPTNVQVSTR